mmetsp:Transcript_14496/g.44792  ORF Transcript_14496/g.44792 Transcript_14496/m.44792 type:complete len:250 (+) Transcript_14496:246-995(+)
MPPLAAPAMAGQQLVCPTGPAAMPAAAPAVVVPAMQFTAAPAMATQPQAVHALAASALVTGPAVAGAGLPLAAAPAGGGQELKSGFEVGERLLSELCTGVSGKAPASSSQTGVAVAAVAAAPVRPEVAHVNRLENVVQGFLGQPWFTPAWSNSGWAFDLQWVTSTLEWYFSDMNLCGDVYLRSLMTPDEGWVPLMLLLAFPRLQALGVDCAILGQAAMCSSSLELDTTAYYTRIRDKARRCQWLPLRPG